MDFADWEKPKILETVPAAGRFNLMRSMAMLTLIGLLSSFALSQTTPQPIRLKIRSADPWAVKAMLEGIPIKSPEMSTLPAFAGLGNAGGQVTNALLLNGKLIVNPTDNSLWYFPNPIR